MTAGDPVTDNTLDPRAEPVAPEPPDVVGERFGDSLPHLRRYAQWLAGAGTVRGLIGPREVPRLWDRHILNSLALEELLPTGARVVDIGSGAGLPGLAVAIVRPDLQVDLVEPLLRRTDFLSEVVADLGLGERVRIIRGRAEDAAVVKAVGSSSFVTARAVAPLDKLIRWSFPLLIRGGSLLALKGSTAEAELDEHRVMLAQKRVELGGVLQCGVGLVDPPTRVVQLIKR
ncbi:16S rRNA (guanine(527)-N(7))-methyltransferase RsmG [soil metagenome]|jgi:16S rRNA (guanine527-N7)-methyltransferase